MMSLDGRNNPFKAAIFVPGLSIKKLKIICVSPLYTQFRKVGVCVWGGEAVWGVCVRLRFYRP